MMYGSVLQSVQIFAFSVYSSSFGYVTDLSLCEMGVAGNILLPGMHVWYEGGNYREGYVCM